jgi:peroxiredoxin
MLELGTTAPDFELSDPARDIYRRDDFSEARALLVVFMCNHCPFVIHIRHALAGFASEYLDKGLAVVGINSNDAVKYPSDSPAMMAREIEIAGYTFPYLFDESQEVARAYRAACTPDFYLFDGNRRLVYRGQFDDSRPGNGIPVSGRDLRLASDQALEGLAVTVDQRPSVGCNIKWR